MTTLSKKQKFLELTKIEDIDEVYKGIEKCNTLQISPKIKFRNLGGSAKIIQLLCTWERLHKEVTITLNKQTDINSHQFRKNKLLLVAFYIADEVLQNGKTIRKEALKKFIPLVEKMHELSSTRGREYKYIFFQGAKNEFLRPFYSGDKFKSRKDIVSVIDTLIKEPISAIKKGSFDKDLENIKTIIYELLSNADQHGRRDINQDEIPKNIRGLYIDIHAFSDTNRESLLKNQEKYVNFLKNVKEVLVISIFDSGEGIVKKFIETTSDKKEKHMTFDEKKDVFKKLFMAGITSSGVPNSGMGLTYVEKSIKDLKGLLSFKTSTLEYFLTPTEKGEYDDKPEYTECTPCVGTSIVALIPLKIKMSND